MDLASTLFGMFSKPSPTVRRIKSAVPFQERSRWPGCDGEWTRRRSGSGGGCFCTSGLLAGQDSTSPKSLISPAVIAVNPNYQGQGLVVAHSVWEHPNRAASTAAKARPRPPDACRASVLTLGGQTLGDASTT